jgi:hypothetical protein
MRGWIGWEGGVAEVNPEPEPEGADGWLGPEPEDTESVEGPMGEGTEESSRSWSSSSSD